LERLEITSYRLIGTRDLVDIMGTLNSLKGGLKEVILGVLSENALFYFAKCLEENRTIGFCRVQTSRIKFDEYDLGMTLTLALAVTLTLTITLTQTQTLTQTLTLALTLTLTLTQTQTLALTQSVYTECGAGGVSASVRSCVPRVFVHGSVTCLHDECTHKSVCVHSQLRIRLSASD